ncbi:nicotinamide riboside transporter PnuC [Algoriphagus halophytocola]|uniref:Nicotinamide riboside transporter PnuC n=1 Tax=Algoriphagus halophytocola TaxID=2991499 RepID=A0ABY6MLJ3_9BACT|nr:MULTISPECIES: nicotinamide riboside transporter PnuC [unclassified Algoriphagus]UZD23064.1 nicotinamide riboside transporter PnuC [Algoriphagus sp. TR-M5]WBL44356.1 nicotinamide riboside transporter PnuC [Algoriphagus sp. TR-M9]
MDFVNGLHLLTEQIKATSLLEWCAVAFGVTEVLLARKNNVLLYPAGIIGILCSGFLLVDAKLYAETLLHAYYLIMSIYGWAMWKNRSADGAPRITRSSQNEQLITWSIALLGWGVLYLMLENFTDSDVPVVDAFVSSTAWAGMWLLAKRKVENWIWLNVSNLVAIPLLFHKQLILISLLTIFLFVVAIFGYLDWNKQLKKDYARKSAI